MNLLPEKIEVICSSDCTPTEGILLGLTMRTSQKNDYNFVFGPTDPTGKVVISKDEIVQQATKQLDLSLMDYFPIEDVYTGNFEINALSKAKLKSAIEAVNLFGRKNYPEGYLEKLQNAFALNVDVTNINITTQ